MLAVIWGLHDGARGQVRLNGQLSDWFRLTLGLRQSAVFSPILFNIFFGEIIRQMRARFLSEGIRGAKIAYRRQGVVGDGLRYGRQKKNVENATIFEVLFADDLVFFAETATDLQQMLSIFNELVRQFGQEISVQKTKVVIISTKIGQEPILEPFFIIGSE